MTESRGHVGSALLQRIRNGDREAGVEFVSHYECRIRRRVRAMLRGCPRCIEDSDDIMQSVLQSFDRRIRDGGLDASKPSGLVGLVFSMADAAAVDAVRKARCVTTHEGRLDAPSDHGDALTAVTVREQRDRLARMLSVLTPSQRLIVHDMLAGRHLRQIARRIGCSTFAVARRWRAIRHVLGQRLTAQRGPRAAGGRKRRP